MAARFIHLCRFYCITGTHLKTAMNVSMRVRNRLALFQHNRLSDLRRMLPDQMLEPDVSSSILPAPAVRLTRRRSADA
jgi:hypothetical protein